ncbi:MAG TPA: NAD-dependent deacylase [bacterium]
MDHTTTNRIKQAVEILRTSNSLFVLTGAGISAESGIPTFRGKDGLWKNYSATDLATSEAFGRDPGLVWKWYHWRQSIILDARPNPAHLALVELEKKFGDFLLLTQNVDNLHRQAGSMKILELHGNIFRARCLGCGKTTDHSIRNGVEKLPTCLSCGGSLRPDIVWFGEPIPQDIWEESVSFLNRSADAALIIGTSSVVWPAAFIPEIARQNKVRTIEINLEPTPVSDSVNVALYGKAGEILPKITKALL